MERHTTMALTVDKFWTLLSESGILKQEKVARLRDSADPRLNSPPQLASWLVSQLALTPFQGQVLAAGSSGPFRFGAFSLEGRVGKPGYQTLFSAHHGEERHPVWLDFLAPIQGESNVALARRVESAQNHCLIRHSALTDCYLLEQLPDYKFLILESPPGLPLDQFVAQHGPVDSATAATWINQLAEGVANLHAGGLCHGRIHPANIFVEKESLRLHRNPLRQPLPLKSPATGNMPDWTLPYEYATPELSAWDRWPDASADLYGLGCVLHFLLTGQPPFEGTSARDIAKQHMNQPPPSVAAVAGERLDQVMQSLLRKTSKSRMGSVADLKQSLAAVLPPSMPSPDPTEPATFPKFWRAIQSRRPEVDREVSKRAADPKFANRTDADFAPSIHSESLLESRILGADREDGGMRWLLPVLGVGLAILAVYFGKVLFEPLDPVPIARVNAAASGSQLPSLGNKNELADDPGEGTSAEDLGGSLVSTNLSDRFDIAEDDGQLLWTPLSAGQPLAFTYGQEGGQVYLAVRPADILEDAEGQRVIESLGPDFQRLRERWEKKYRVNLETVERLTIVISADQHSRPVFVNDVSLKTGTKLPGNWIEGDSIDTDSGPVFTSGSLACLVPSGSAQRRFVIGPAKLITTIAERGNQPPLMRRDLDLLRAASDSQALITVLLAPNYLLHDGRGLVAPAYASLPKSMDRFFGDGVNGLMFSAQLEQSSLFFELRASTTLEAQKTLKNEMPAKIADLSQRMKSYIANLHRLDIYWEQIALRYDSMLQFVSQQTRVGIENRQLVINAHLPSTAAHNLVLASELALAAGVSDTPVAEVAATAVKELPSLAHVLMQRTSLNIPQQSLEFSMRDLEEDINENILGLPFPFKIEIAGADLQLDGITRNQQIRNFEGKDQRIYDLLTGLVMRANPVTTVKKPNDPDQKLVWIIERPPAGNGDPYILITTRKAAKKRGISLPKFFRTE